MKFYPYEKGGGAQKVLAMLKGRGGRSFGVVPIVPYHYTAQTVCRIMRPTQRREIGSTVKHWSL